MNGKKKAAAFWSVFCACIVIYSLIFQTLAQSPPEGAPPQTPPETNPVDPTPLSPPDENPPDLEPTPQNPPVDAPPSNPPSTENNLPPENLIPQNSPPPQQNSSVNSSAGESRSALPGVGQQLLNDPNAKDRFDVADDFSFNPLKVMRDPFAPSKSQRIDGSASELDEDALCKKKLIQYDINQINLVGVLSSGGGAKAHALLTLPTGLSCVVELNARVGRRNGRVTKIRSSEVEILEEFTDFKNRKRPDTTTLVLAP